MSSLRRPRANPTWRTHDAPGGRGRGRSSARRGVRGGLRVVPVSRSWPTRGVVASAVEPVGLVGDRGVELAQLRVVRAPVVRAEQQLAAGRRARADVGLGPAPVTTVHGGEGRWRGWRSRRPFPCSAGCSQMSLSAVIASSSTIRPHRFVPDTARDLAFAQRVAECCDDVSPGRVRKVPGVGPRGPRAAKRVSRPRLVSGSAQRAPVPGRVRAPNGERVRPEGLHRPAPVGAGGARGGPQAPGHVHRVHRLAAASCTASGRSSTTRSTRRWPAHCDRIQVVLLPATARSRCTTTAAASRSTPSRKTGLTGVEVVFTKLHAGGKFGGGSYTASGGLHGVGASVVNALSARLDVEVDRGGKTYAMSFRRGEPGCFADVATGDRGPDRAVHALHRALASCAVVGQGQAGRHRHPDPLLGRPRRSSSRDAELRLRRADHPGPADLVPRPGPEPGHPRRAPPAGHAGRAGDRTRRHSSTTAASPSSSSTSRRTPPVTDVWRLQGTGTSPRPSRCSTPPATCRRPRSSASASSTSRCAGAPATTPRCSSFVNIIATPKGGTHLAGFEQALLKMFRKQLEVNAPAAQGRQRQAREGRRPRRPDRRRHRPAGRAAVRGPDQGGARHLGGARHRRPGRRAGARPPGSTSTKRGEKQQAALLLEKVVSEMKSRISARLHKETQRRKNALETSSLPAKLADCRTTDVERSELFIVEGDSALGTAKLARARATTRRCCRSAARSSTSRRRRSPTCSRTPSAPRSSR